MATIEDFELKQAHKPLAEYTLEQMITEGESDEKDKAEKPEQKSINCMPHYLIAIINELCRQHQKLGIGEAQRLTAKLGQAVIQDRFGKLIEQIADRRSVIFQKTTRCCSIKASIPTNSSSKKPLVPIIKNVH